MESKRQMGKFIWGPISRSIFETRKSMIVLHKTNVLGVVREINDMSNNA